MDWTRSEKAEQGPGKDRCAGDGRGDAAHARHGAGAAAEARASPGIKIVYMSGYLEHNSDAGFVPDSAHLQKPFSRESLLAKLMREALGQESSEPVHSMEVLQTVVAP